MARPKTRKERREERRTQGLVEQKDGSYRFAYRRCTYVLRIRRHVETDTWDIASLWSERHQRFVPFETPRYQDRWEALLAGQLPRSIQEARHVAERTIDAWLNHPERGSQSRAG